MHTYLKYLYTFLLEPKKTDDEEQRKELICNIILLFALLLLTILDILVMVNYLLDTTNYIGIHPSIMFSVTSCTFILLYLSRIGYTNIASQSITWILIAGGIYGQTTWGADLPSVILLWSFVITASSILISTRYSFNLSICIGLGTILLQILASQNIFKPLTEWKTHGFKIDDAIEYSLVFILIAGVSWVSNREIVRSLMKVKQAKTELKKERDLLEIKVIERTEQLHMSQVEKINSMYQMVEFGRISSGLFHDLMTPLNTLSLAILHIKPNGLISQTESIYEVSNIEKHLNQCIQTSKKVADFINLAKRQIQNSHTESKFKVSDEIENVISILESKARRENVSIFFNYNKNTQIYGSPILFGHIMTNLISNAIDSYERVPDRSNPVNKLSIQQAENKINKILIHCKRKKKHIEIRVRDFGIGIPIDIQPHIFETFFTTKSTNGCGIGLSATKHTIEKYFKGTISFTSLTRSDITSQNAQHGTIFSINIPTIKNIPKNTP